MRRLLIAMSAFALLLASSVGADEEKKGDKKVEKKAPEAVKPGPMFQELIGKFRGAKAADRPKLLEEYAEKFISYAKANSKQDDAPEALFYVLQLPLAKEKASLKKTATEILSKDYAKTPAIAKHIKRLAINPDDTVTHELAMTIYKDNPDKTARAYAAKALLKAAEQVTTIADRLKEDENLKDRLVKARGKEAVQAIMDAAAKAPQLKKELEAKLDGELKGVFPNLTVGAKAPEVESQDLDGKKVKLSDYKGKVVVLDIWATWCPPCKGMIPHTRELVKKMENKPFVFVSVSADAKKDTLTDFIKETPMPWTHWWNGATGGIVEAWEIEAYPTIFVIDAKGVIAKKIVGANNKELDEAVEKAVKDAQGSK